MKWFGDSWGAPVCDPDEHLPTPVGEKCEHGCGKPIEDGDQGVVLPYLDRQWRMVPYHHGCFMRSILGPDWEKIVAEQPHVYRQMHCTCGRMGECRACKEFADLMKRKEEESRESDHR